MIRIDAMWLATEAVDSRIDELLPQRWHSSER